MARPWQFSDKATGQPFIERTAADRGPSRTGTINQIRAFVLERGVAVRQGSLAVDPVSTSSARDYGPRKVRRDGQQRFTAACHQEIRRHHACRRHYENRRHHGG